ncbi:hypothetical protein [Methanosphaera sp.]|nr:hypothetical protein [Methanosphaera sp.]
MNMIKKAQSFIVNLSGCLFMLLVMFYLNYYEFNPIYKPIYD